MIGLLADFTDEHARNASTENLKLLFCFVVGIAAVSWWLSRKDKE